jgi:HEAT repeat protein
MQLLFSARNVIIAGAVAAAAYYGYKSFYGDIETRDMNKLFQAHRLASTIKRQAVRRRILGLYDPDEHYGTFLKALEHRSPVTQALAVDVLTEKLERRAVPELLEMLADPYQDGQVKASLAMAFRVFPRKAAIPHLIRLTKAEEEHDARVAAHDTLVELLKTGAQVKFGDAMHQHWTEWWRDHGGDVKLP